MIEKTRTGRSDIVVALRNFSYVWLIIMLASLMSAWFIGNTELEVLRRVHGIIHAAILALYLSLTKVEQRLGFLHLPVALGIAIFGLFIVHMLSIWYGLRSEELASLTILFNAVTFMSVSVVTILIVGWRYHISHVTVVSVIYSLLIAISLTLSFADRPDHFLAAVIFISLFSATSLGAVGYFVWRLSKAEQSQRQQLAAANRQLRRQAIQREELTISRERNRLARELHDTLAHSLSGVAVQIEASHALWPTNPDAAELMLLRANEMARTGLTEARRALQALRAKPLQDLGLGLALRAIGEDAAARAGATLQTELPPHLTTDLEPHVEQNLYRIAQEALENIVRHARAKTISLRLIETANDLQLAIVDDGIGFDLNSDRAQGHYGLQGMAERVALSDASLEVKSQVGEGTAIVVRLRNA